MEEHDFKSVKAKCLAWEASDRNQLSMSQPGSISTNKISSYKKDKMKQLRSRSKFEKTDTGTGECLANDALLENLGIEYDTTQKCIISAANGSSMECLGSVEV
ncbi:Uncharacterized protein FKW44_009872 [Caligus rogercresseyi]|uniref:Uncharacterized protein n=1 Tax=Caligus rogercresseyi TaxID=217165 RepID=A0A7T8HFT9_CALRO|nr:Uncharacterized protein FKW44_009872 [Caligus rogercresseyi]